MCYSIHSPFWKKTTADNFRVQATRLKMVDWTHACICSFKYLSASYEPNTVLGVKDIPGIKDMKNISPHEAYMQVGGDRETKK